MLTSAAFMVVHAGFASANAAFMVASAAFAVVTDRRLNWKTKTFQLREPGERETGILCFRL